jgi:MOSC domain-containing protein YiiM
MPTLLGVQVAKARRAQIGGRAVLTAIFKTAVTGPVPVMPLGLVGDEQGDLSVHGGLDKAVYAYPSEHYPFWADARAHMGHAEIDDALLFGSIGENLTLEGLLETDVWVGDVFQFPHCRLRVTSPRDPCYKFNAAMGFSAAARTMTQTGRCGWYMAVDEPGTISARESFEVVPGSRSICIADAFKVMMLKPLS